MSEVLTHKCPNCGGPLLFDPTKQLFHCEYCLSEFSEEALTSLLTAKSEKTSAEADLSADFDEQSLNHTDSEDEGITLELFSCPSCGAEIVTDETTAATFCYYCHNPVVLSGRVSGEFLPESILPFAVDRKKAVEHFLAWGRKKKFVPKDFFNDAQIEKITGVYFPYWLIDGELSATYHARGTTIRVWRAGDYEMTETKYFNIAREGTMNFRNFIKNALKKNQTLTMIQSVQPFNLQHTKKFSSKYLSGFQADKRDLNYQDLQEEVRSELKGYGQSLLKDTVKGYTQIFQEQTDFHGVKDTSQYVLLPVWVLTYRGRGDKNQEQLYYYAMNGDSGKTSGRLPVDKKKVGLFAAAIFSAVFILVLIGGYFI
ncbi:TFIIB-type zinc ribbon-containing protein [Vagococcus elongatus]|uniref:ATP-binding protein n=1 Tax=Vagococcus elongatus TaxID=180344 RepID=A0A430ANT6_9ENTE|nr:TFIIB-type zinc ribbon-containing protein [Vagococcus elongatus]RSU09840.1 ATP-binding protein [Vagococcus elongatus]